MDRELQDYKVNSMGQRATDAETSLILQFYPTLDKKKAKKKGIVLLTNIPKPEVRNVCIRPMYKRN